MASQELTNILHQLKQNGISPDNQTFWDLFRKAPYGDAQSNLSWTIGKIRTVNIAESERHHRQKNLNLLDNIVEGNAMVDSDILMRGIRQQVKHVGLDPNDPTFIRFAQQAPEDRPLYDQLSWAIDKTRQAKEYVKPKVEQSEPEPVSLDEALEASAVKL